MLINRNHRWSQIFLWIALKIVKKHSHTPKFASLHEWVMNIHGNCMNHSNGDEKAEISEPVILCNEREKRQHTSQTFTHFVFHSWNNTNNRNVIEEFEQRRAKMPHTYTDTYTGGTLTNSGWMSMKGKYKVSGNFTAHSVTITTKNEWEREKNQPNTIFVIK